jgi:superfamily II DNA or RNA helicase
MAEIRPFHHHDPNVVGNDRLRAPQRETYAALEQFANEDAKHREAGIVLPVGCGKSGCIALAPFAFRSSRTLVVAPGLNIASQLLGNFDPTDARCFYVKCNVITAPPFPEPVEIRGTTTNQADLDESDVVITNIQQLQGDENRWLVNLPEDYFDLILFDEGHHTVAATYQKLKEKFPNARIVNFSATPLRADGKKMEGRILYSFPVARAIEEGFVKRLKALVLNPKTLKFVRDEDGREVEVSLEEVRRLGEEDAAFRRSIVTSKETLVTIVDASLRELDRIRTETGDPKHKVIASALNFAHCHQIVQAYRARGRSAEFVHSKEEGPANAKVLKKLESHEIDVIVQVRKLGEGFDHPYLSVAAVFSIFANLSPFVQFVGRIMRTVPGASTNHGTVVFHAGANIAARWEDFQDYSQADQEYFQQLLPMEDLDFGDASELDVTPRTPSTVEVREQSGVTVEEIPLLQNSDAVQALDTLRALGYSPDEVKRAMEHQPLPTTKVRERQASRAALDDRIKTDVGRILAERGLSPHGHDLDRKRLGKTNFVVLKSAIDRKVNEAVGRGTGARHEFSKPELDEVESQFKELVQRAVDEVF